MDAAPATTMGIPDPDRVGYCYELTANFALHAILTAGDTSWSIVHGTIQGELVPGLLLRPIPHAWAWDPDTHRVYEPATDTIYDEAAFRRLYRPTFDHVFGPEGPDSWRRVCIRFGHYGPWDGTVGPVKDG